MAPKPDPKYWSGKVAIVTGASRGLGSIIARTAALAGARVALVARGRERLDQAVGSLREEGFEAMGVVADVTSDDDVQRMVDTVLDEWGRLDLLVNNAGRSPRGAIDRTTPEMVADLMELNLLSVIRCTRAALVHLIERRGHLVNIGSIASKTAARYMGAYPTTKHAVAAYTAQLRLELEPKGLHTLLVCPGPIASDEVRVRGAEELEGVPEWARKPGGGAKVKAFDPQMIADEILVACERRKAELMYPKWGRLLVAIAALSPRANDWIVRKFTK